MAESYDVVVIGAGPGGYVAAIRAAQLGKTTAIVERDAIGGRCLNYACIPAKAVLRAADVLSEVREAGDFGISVPEPEVDFTKVAARRAQVVKTLTGGVSGLIRKNRIEVIEGSGSLNVDANVVVGDRTIEARAVILATGSVKRPLPGVSFGQRVIGTEEAWALEQLPGVHGRARRRRLRRRDRVRVRAAGHARAVVRGARPGASHGGPGDQQARRAELQEAGHRRRDVDAHLRRRQRRRRGDVRLRRRPRAKPSGWSSPPVAARTSRVSASGPPVSRSPRAA